MATYVLTVNGVAKQLLPGWVITESANGRNRMDFAMQSLNGSFRAVNDDAVDANRRRDDDLRRAH
jgi:hypothetical protein